MITVVIGAGTVAAVTGLFGALLFFGFFVSLLLRCSRLAIRWPFHHQEVDQSLSASCACSASHEFQVLIDLHDGLHDGEAAMVKSVY